MKMRILTGVVAVVLGMVTATAQTLSVPGRGSPPGAGGPVNTIVGPLTPGYYPRASTTTNLVDGQWYNISAGKLGYNGTDQFLWGQNSATGNLTLGFFAGDSVTTGGDNTAVGYEALTGLTSGDDNTAVGDTALRNLTTGTFNTAVGSEAGQDITTGTQNTAIGSSTMSFTAGVTGSYNSALGSSALNKITSGEQNTGVGYEAGTHITSGSSNTGLGSGAVGSTTASFNTGIGRASLISATTGSTNTALGVLSGQSITSGTGNIGIGYDAGPIAAAPTIVNTVAVGFGAKTTNSHEIVIGNPSNTKVIFPITSSTGGGTKALMDDGTFKTLSVGGSLIFTNDSGVIKIYNGNSVFGLNTNSAEMRVANITIDGTQDNGVLIGGGSGSTVGSLAQNTAGYILTDNGPGLPPSWEPPTSAGTTINSQDGRLPVRGNATSFDNSPVYQMNAGAISIGSDNPPTDGIVLDGDNGTVVIDSDQDVTLTSGNIVEVKNNGTNMFFVGWQGGLYRGKDVISWWGDQYEGDLFIAHSDTTLGGPTYFDINISVTDGVNNGELYMYPGVSDGRIEVENNNNRIKLTSNVNGDGTGFSIDVGGVTVTQFNPGGADGTTPYVMGTSQTHTSGNLQETENNSTNVFVVDYSGAISLSGQTNLLSIDGGVLKLDGQPIGGNVNQTINYTNTINFHGKTTFHTNVYVTNGYSIFIDGIDVRKKELGGACSDETTALTTGTAKLTFRMPYKMTVTAVRANLSTTQTSGSIFTVDINESGSSILSTKLTIDNSEKTTTTAATPAVISDTSLADDAEITVDIDQVGDGTAKGLKIWIIGNEVP